MVVWVSTSYGARFYHCLLRDPLSDARPRSSPRRMPPSPPPHPPPHAIGASIIGSAPGRLHASRAPFHPIHDGHLPLLRPTLLPTPSAPPSSDSPQQRTNGGILVGRHRASGSTPSPRPRPDGRASPPPKSCPHCAPNLAMPPTASPAVTFTLTSSPRLRRPHRSIVCAPLPPCTIPAIQMHGAFKT
jgi:hypothetical protein